MSDAMALLIAGAGAVLLIFFLAGPCLLADWIEFFRNGDDGEGKK